MLDNIKSKYIQKIVLKKLDMKRLLQLIKINNRYKKFLNINIKDYQKFVQIIFEVSLSADVYGLGLRLGDEQNRKYIHCLKKDGKKEIEDSNLG